MISPRITPARLRELAHHLATDERDAPLPDGESVLLDANERGMLMAALTMAAKQIEAATRDPLAGKLWVPGMVSEMGLAVDEEGRFVYSANEQTVRVS